MATVGKATSPDAADSVASLEEAIEGVARSPSPLSNVDSAAATLDQRELRYFGN